MAVKLVDCQVQTASVARLMVLNAMTVVATSLTKQAILHRKVDTTTNNMTEVINTTVAKKSRTLRAQMVNVDQPLDRLVQIANRSMSIKLATL